MTSSRTARPASTVAAGRALLLDDHSYTAVQTCRQLGKSNYLVHAFAQRSAPVFASRYCQSRFIFDPNDSAWPRLVEKAAEESFCDVIYLCSEHLLNKIARHDRRSPVWSKLPLPEPSVLQALPSKNAIMRFMGDSGIPVPKTFFPNREEDLDPMAQSLGFPLVVKGEGGESSQTIRIIRSRDDLLDNYRAVRKPDQEQGTLPCLQQFLNGPTYNVGGLFQEGRPIRICAGRMVLMEPYRAGMMMKGVTERPPKLIANALAAFEALRYTGFGDADFVYDRSEGQFKFLEINPEVGANIGLAECAGVDFHGPYRALVGGEFVPTDLNFREGISYFRVAKRVLATLKRPWLAAGFLKDLVDPAVHSDCDGKDLLPDVHLLLNSVRRRSRPSTTNAKEKALRGEP